jgi:hypothetical protein
MKGNGAFSIHFAVPHAYTTVVLSVCIIIGRFSNMLQHSECLILHTYLSKSHFSFFHLKKIAFTVLGHIRNNHLRQHRDYLYENRVQFTTDKIQVKFPLCLTKYDSMKIWVSGDIAPRR